MSDACPELFHVRARNDLRRERDLGTVHPAVFRLSGGDEGPDARVAAISANENVADDRGAVGEGERVSAVAVRGRGHERAPPFDRVGGARVEDNLAEDAAIDLGTDFLGVLGVITSGGVGSEEDVSEGIADLELVTLGPEMSLESVFQTVFAESALSTRVSEVEGPAEVRAS